MIKHVVSFRLSGSDEIRRQKAESFKAALMALPGQIECLKGLEVGINCNPNEKWDLVLIAEVENMVALAEYAAHPLHQEAVAIIKDCLEERACVDFKI